MAIFSLLCGLVFCFWWLFGLFCGLFCGLLVCLLNWLITCLINWFWDCLFVGFLGKQLYSRMCKVRVTAVVVVRSCEILKLLFQSRWQTTDTVSLSCRWVIWLFWGVKSFWNCLESSVVGFLLRFQGIRGVMNWFG